MSRTNHNMLYFVAIRGNRPLNMGICLWKAQNRLSERGLDAELAPIIVQTPAGLGSDPHQKPSLREAYSTRRKTGANRARFCANCGQSHLIHLMTAKVPAVHGSRLRKGLAPTGQDVAIARLFPALFNHDRLRSIFNRQSPQFACGRYKGSHSRHCAIPCVFGPLHSWQPLRRPWLRPPAG
jgi:hypothetical protein